MDVLVPTHLGDLATLGSCGALRHPAHIAARNAVVTGQTHCRLAIPLIIAPQDKDQSSISARRPDPGAADFGQPVHTTLDTSQGE
ncbi:hypothetical protein [Actinoallomurus sp. CA-150999]|uniref:hypothetical protein n=1 Tax=Actinoallomurus sp. CA-150999 TaxID=3239887 RepID=UPI003D8E6C0D